MARRRFESAPRRQAVAGLAPLSNLVDLIPLVEHAEGWATLRAALAAGRSGAVEGAWGSSAALATAALGRQVSGTLLVLIPHPGDLEAWAADLESFAGQPPALFPLADAADSAPAVRLKLLKQLRGPTPPPLLLATLPALMQPVPPANALAALSRELVVGSDVRLEELMTWLVEHGYTRKETAELPGDLARRGGIVDVFPPDATAPYRMELFGDELTSLRTFAPETQRSFGDPLHSVEIMGLHAAASPAGEPPASVASLAAYLPKGSVIVLVEPDELREQGRLFLERLADLRGHFTVDATFQHLLKHPTVALSNLPLGSIEATCPLRVESVQRFSGDLTKVRGELATLAATDRVIVACENEGQRQRLAEILAPPPSPGEEVGRGEGDSRIPELLLGSIHAGFRLVEPGVVVLAARELFHKEELPARRIPQRRFETRAIDSFLDLNEGDLVVHVTHGIARYRSMQTLENKGQLTDHLTLEFAEGTKLYVPVDKIDLVQKYVGGGQAEPELSKLGGQLWQRRKERVAEAVADMAADLLELQAKREAIPGFACGPDSDWQREFEAAFPYPETPDQLSALADIKADLQRQRPMDRLICGDVGFGKTEVALRAAFKMVDNGRQVAVLVPTTVLAEQHFRTFSSRLADYPFRVACLSRFRTGKESKDILARLAAGGVDVIVGTHRLLSKDVAFHDLGLVIIDEEQRFGVEHKERLKKFRTTVDVLTLTATPIPRTLHLSMLGLRDIASLETPPRDRIAIETRIHRFDGPLIRQAILRELNREGQVYFVHNRVQSIHALANELRALVPEARFVVGHGQMSEHELEDAMVKFLRREADVLVATTIIENGLDIPRANTIFIHQAENYGLADLHQLRGRVGRHIHRAFCYLLLDPAKKLTPPAARRLKAIEEFSELGAGFRIAMRDLEIRGAGNILGTEQSGHIATVGYELYCQMLENAVRRLKNLPAKTPLEVTIELPAPALLPRDYVPSQKQRMEVYRRLSRVQRADRLADFRQELTDRFGPIPEQTEQLVRLQELRILAARWQIATIHLERIDLVLGYRNRAKIDKLASLSEGRLRVVDAASAYYRLKTPEERSPAGMLAILDSLLRK